MIGVILCAAGKGERAGFAENKLFCRLNGKTVLETALSAFLTEEIDEILVTANAADRQRIEEICAPYPQCRVVPGGRTRSESVRSALAAVKGDIVLIHDGARPFVTKKIIADCIESVKRYGSGICALPATDTTVLAAAGGVMQVPDRAQVFTVQTPQGFRTAAIRRAYEMAGEASFTDDSSVFSRYIAPAHLFLGDPANKKLTFREDFMQETFLTGVGVDTHAYGKAQDFIVLGTVRIPAPSGLVAHSDGDVLLHAIMDALLSAAGLRDIGFYFPDTDPAYAGADSCVLLKRVVDLLAEQNCRPVNVSAAIQAQVPKLSPYIPAMRDGIAELLGIPPERVGIAAGTTEGLGPVGEGKCITAIATVSVRQG